MKEIYLSAIQEVIDGKMSKEDLWEIINEHISAMRHKKEELTLEIIRLRLDRVATIKY